MGAPNSVLDLIVGYNVSVLDPSQSIQQIGLAFNGTGTGDLNKVIVRVTETAFSAGELVGNIAVNFTGLDLQDPPFEDGADMKLNGLYSSLSVVKDIQLNILEGASDLTTGSLQLR